MKCNLDNQAQDSNLHSAADWLSGCCVTLCQKEMIASLARGKHQTVFRCELSERGPALIWLVPICWREHGECRDRNKVQSQAENTSHAAEQ